TGRQHHWLARAQFHQGLVLAAAEAFFPLLIEDIGDVDARGTFDLRVTVDEGHAQHAAEVLADGGLAGAHGADKVEVSLAEHGLRSIRPTGSGRLITCPAADTRWMRCRRYP